MTELLDIKKITVDINKIEVEHTIEKNVSLSILRLDKFHHEIQGNKFFKLYYFLEKAITAQKKIITFGGAYSNHLAATASACKMFGLTSIGVVRGEEPKKLSHTLLFCKKQGMQLEFISREEYSKKEHDNFKIKLNGKFGDHILVPEGGYSKEGMEGAALISNFFCNKNFTHVCCAVGTATTLSGLIEASEPSQTIIGFSVLDLTDIENRIEFLSGDTSDKKYALINNYHFGGYAKKTPELICFMNEFYEAFTIPTDFVYTAKMMFGVFDLINKNYFPAGSKILCIHTGGLQGNLSLPAGTLNF